MKLEMEIRDIGEGLMIRNKMEGEVSPCIVQFFGRALGRVAGELISKSIKDEERGNIEARKLLLYMYESDFSAELEEALGLKEDKETKEE